MGNNANILGKPTLLALLVASLLALSFESAQARGDQPRGYGQSQLGTSVVVGSARPRR